MELDLHYVLENDMDLLILRNVYKHNEFEKFILSVVFGSKYSNLHVVKASHSVEYDLGESDIVLFLECDEGKVELHLEDKVDAKAMPEQCNRYLKRCARNIEEGKCIDSTVCLVAPQAYLDVEKQPYPYKLSYQKILEELKKVNADEFDIKTIELAIYKYDHKEELNYSEIKTRFWNRLYAYLDTTKLKGMFEVTRSKGENSDWLRLKTIKDNVRPVFKFNKGFFDIQFEKLEGKVNSFVDKYQSVIPKDASIALTKKSAFIRFEIPQIDLSGSFDGQEESVKEAVKIAVKALNNIKSII